MKLLAEVNENISLISEGEGETKKHYLKGLFLEFDNFNKNNRIYRSEWCDPKVQDYIREKMNSGRGWGELDHPDSTTINLKNVSHRVTELHKEGTNWFGKAVITDTPMGQVVKGLMASGGRVGSSSRAMGSVKNLEERKLEVQQDLRFLTVSDVVSDPSAHGALMDGLMENVEYFFDEKTGMYKVSEPLREEIKKMSKTQLSEAKTNIFARFLKELNNNK